MTVKRMDNVLIVVDDLEITKAFFVELGLKLEGQTTVEGPSVGNCRAARLRRAWQHKRRAILLLRSPIFLTAS